MGSVKPIAVPNGVITIDCTDIIHNDIAVYPQDGPILYPSLSNKILLPFIPSLHRQLHC